MNELFSLRRFAALAVKYYRENLKTILVLAGIMFVMTFFVLCKQSPFTVSYKVGSAFALEEFFRETQVFFANAFWMLLGLFIAGGASVAFEEFTRRKQAVGALLLPASTFEKFLLRLVNATVGVFLLHLVVFYITANIVCAYRYGGIELETEAHFTKHVPEWADGREIRRPTAGNVFRVIGHMNEPKVYWEERLDAQEHSQRQEIRRPQKSPLMLWSFLLYANGMVAAVFLWGSLTFRKQAALKTILVHALFFAVIGFCLIYVITMANTTYWRLNDHSEPGFLNKSSFLTTLPSWSAILLWIYPVAYLWVTFKKLKNEQI